MVLAALTGCQKGDTASSSEESGSGTSQNGEEPASNEIVTIEFYGFNQNPSHTFFQWQQDYFAEKINVNVDIIPGDNEKLQTMLSSGDLPDMGMYAVNGSLSQAIKGGHLMDLTSYEDQIPNYTEKWPESVQYSKEYQSDGTGKLYGLITQLGDYNAFAMDTGTYAMNVRWDIYEKAGRPKVTDMYSFLDAAVQMKEVYPKTEDGLETYMIGLFPDNGALLISPTTKYLEVNGIARINQTTVYDVVNDKPEYIFEKGGSYYQALKWLATANQMGLLDPDSMTQNYDMSQAKIKESEQYYTCMVGNYCDGYNTSEKVNGENPKGFLPLIWEGLHPVVYKDTKIGENPYAISAKTDKLDACLKFANLIYDEDAVMNMQGGPQGELWDIIDGKYVLTDEAETFRMTGVHKFGTGEEASDWWGYWGLQASSCHSKYPNATFRITDSIAWADKKIENSKIHDMYEEYYGERRPIEVWKKYDALCYQPGWKKLIETMPSELEDIQNNAKGIIEPLQWQAIMTTQNDNEFDELFDEIMKQAEELNVKSVYDWTADQIVKAKQAFKNFE